ncbi:ribonuclease H-like domain-containing protein [Tanacetum coccineum]
MDRSRWIYKIDQSSEEYLTNLSIRVAEDDRKKKGKLRISCPCQDCYNILTYIDSDEIKGHLISTGFVERYTCWSWHGELLPEHDTVDFDHSEDDDNDSYDSGHDNLDDMLHDLEGEIDEDNHAKFQELFVDAEKPLYDGCKKFTKLSPVLRLFDVKAANGISDKGFTDIFKVVHDFLPEDNELPISVYKAKKMICPIGLEIKRIHACPNDCVLYTNEKKDLHNCHVCNSSRLKRLFANSKDAKLFRWHAEERKKDGKIRHVADSPQWRNIDNIENFGEEIRNIRFRLSSDGINPFGNMSSRHSTWPVLLCIYNLPPWLCMIEDNQETTSMLIDPEVLDEWQSDIILTLCQLEMYFPPSFFDVMVHLVSHIVREIKACGPTFLRNMYPFERYMGFLKGHVRNRYRPEASIIQGYATEEVIEFCTDYMKDVPSIGVPQSRHEGRLQGVGTIGRNMEPPNQDDLYRAHFTVLEHMTCVAPFIHEHKTMTVERLGFGLRCVTKYQGYDINGYTFYTKQQDEKSTLQNSGVMLIAATPEFSMGDHEARSTIAKKSYYGVIQEIWELDYLSFTIPMLKCKWVNNEGGVKVDDYGFTSVNLSTNGYASEPFILAKQANQIFFVEDPSDSRWHIVLQGKRRIVGVENVVDEDEYDQFDELPPFSIGASSSNDVIDDTTYLRSDHDEGTFLI